MRRGQPQSKLTKNHHNCSHRQQQRHNDMGHKVQEALLPVTRVHRLGISDDVQFN
jgi:hypothetical protein